MKEKLTTLFFGIIGIALLAHPAFGQEQPGLRERADELFRKYEYANAAILYTKLADSKRPKLADLERLAHCYMQMKDYESAENWYARVVGMEDSSEENLLRYGEVLKVNGKYAEAKVQLETYAARTGDTARVNVAIAGCDSAVVWMANPTAHKLRNEAVNTSLAEFSVFPMGDKVYYTGEPDSHMQGVGTYGWTGNSFLRIYTADRAGDNTLHNPVIAVNSINNAPYHIGPVAAAHDGKTLYVTRTYPGKEGSVSREDRRKYMTNKLELYLYTQTDDDWEAMPFAHNDVAAYSVGHAALSGDGNILYFVSDMPGGQGGTDIWYCEKQADGSWGTPINAGATINSAGNELFPNIGPNGILYYASDGFPGMGGLDVFQATGSKATWTSPANLGYPVNSARDDFAYITNYEGEEGLAGYLSSNRKGGKGSDDIYGFTYERPKIVIVLRGTTADKNTGDRLPETMVTLYDGTRSIVAKKSSTENGTFEFVLDRNSTYTVLGQKEKYHADSAKVSTVGITTSDTLEVALLLEPVFEVGKTFELENIYYDFDKHNIRPDAAAILDELVRTLRDNPTLKIELSSHTDSRGSDAYNMALSQRRAQAAVDYLVSRGIARDRMVAKGYGETRLVNECGNGVPCSREQHQANRRTEVTVLAY
ncbi:WD40-like Beta Propeller Repeat [Parapedobacter luteus]|uniref:WD40-like Beta Propeller Repeat n=1 Tax=Parapedobacter luteus TaxID=623280 RepID=A0A1T5CID7_9SPHI|nr:OmpA family protein [Parapedobacter luteus]SKB58900.1 WD40-like Beta Propeller Repeat [Parapedobacter luteus]